MIAIVIEGPAAAAQLAEVAAERAELKETAGRLQRQVEQQRQSLAKNRVSLALFPHRSHHPLDCR